MKILPLVIPNINFKEFLLNTKELFGYSFSEKLDKSGITVGDYNSFLTMLEEFETSLLINQEFLHFSIGLMELQTSLFTMLRQRSVNILIKESKRAGYYFCLCAGTLKQWKEFIVFCTQSDNYDVRDTGKQLHFWFEKMGLLFREYKRISYPDSTYKLEKL